MRSRSSPRSSRIAKPGVGEVSDAKKPAHLIRNGRAIERDHHEHGAVRPAADDKQVAAGGMGGDGGVGK